jgi:hypothetical protein
MRLAIHRPTQSQRCCLQDSYAEPESGLVCRRVAKDNVTTPYGGLTTESHPPNVRVRLKLRSLVHFNFNWNIRVCSFGQHDTA